MKRSMKSNLQYLCLFTGPVHVLLIFVCKYLPIKKSGAETLQEVITGFPVLLTRQGQLGVFLSQRHESSDILDDNMTTAGKIFGRCLLRAWCCLPCHGQGLTRFKGYWLLGDVTIYVYTTLS